jgi:hypothetical protein
MFEAGFLEALYLSKQICQRDPKRASLARVEIELNIITNKSNKSPFWVNIMHSVEQHRSRWCARKVGWLWKVFWICLYEYSRQLTSPFWYAMHPWCRHNILVITALVPESLVNKVAPSTCPRQRPIVTQLQPRHRHLFIIIACQFFPRTCRNYFKNVSQVIDNSTILSILNIVLKRGMAYLDMLKVFVVLDRPQNAFESVALWQP